MSSSEIFYSAIFDWIDPLKKGSKYNKGLGICYGQALMKIGHKILLANPIEMFLVKIPFSPQSKSSQEI